MPLQPTPRYQRFHQTIPPHTIPYHTIQHHTIPYHTTPYHTTLNHTTVTILYHNIPHLNISKHTMLCYIIQGSIARHTISPQIIQYYTTQHHKMQPYLRIDFSSSAISPDSIQSFLIRRELFRCISPFVHLIQQHTVVETNHWVVSTKHNKFIQI